MNQGFPNLLRNGPQGLNFLRNGVQRKRFLARFDAKTGEKLGEDQKKKKAFVSFNIFFAGIFDGNQTE